jgi:hypothetical protein
MLPEIEGNLFLTSVTRNETREYKYVLFLLSNPRYNLFLFSVSENKKACFHFYSMKEKTFLLLDSVQKQETTRDNIFFKFLSPETGDNFIFSYQTGTMVVDSIYSKSSSFQSESGTFRDVMMTSITKEKNWDIFFASAR